MEGRIAARFFKENEMRACDIYMIGFDDFLFLNNCVLDDFE